MEYEKLLDFVTELGFQLMYSGAEIYRTEESMRRMLDAYRLHAADVFAIPSCIIVSMTAPDGQTITRMRRIPPHGTDIERLERCNQLCRRLCGQPLPVRESRFLLEQVSHNTPRFSASHILLGYGIAPAFFAPLFGGGFRDAVGAAVGGLAVGVCMLYGKRLTGSNNFFRTAICSAVAALASLLLVRLGLGTRVDAVTISILMMLVPGVALTNAMREIMAGDTLSALSRMADVFLVAGAIALGAAAGLALGRML